jgi:hypothetical protein
MQLLPTKTYVLKNQTARSKTKVVLLCVLARLHFGSKLKRLFRVEGLLVCFCGGQRDFKHGILLDSSQVKWLYSMLLTIAGIKYRIKRMCVRFFLSFGFDKTVG